jgi:FkbM family methyltransferase
MSNLLAHAVGPSGRVLSFEPHPLVFRALSANVARWREVERIDTVDARPAAVSAAAGTLPLGIESDEFARNKGTASLEGAAHDKGTASLEGAAHDKGTALEGAAAAQAPVGGGDRDPPHTIDVRTVRLADELESPVGVMKLDVEHHELAALRGAEPLLAQGLIRDVLFEEHRPPPTPVTALLEEHGYTVLGLRQGTIGPLLSTPAQAYSKQLWDPPALLATRDPERARRRLRRRGWVSLTTQLRGAAAVRASAA